MNRFKLLLTIILLNLSFNSYSQHKVTSTAFDKMLGVILSHDVPEVSVADFSISEKVVVVDAREKNEYDISHLPRALWVGFKDFDIQRLSTVPKNQKIVVYCSIGYRSEKIAKKLIESGYTDVVNLYGGIFEWVNQDKTVKDASGTTHKVHGFSRMWSIWLNKGEKVL